MKISDYLTITNRPQIIELSDDFILNGLAYSKYTLQNENTLNFFFLNTNINNDYRYMPIDNLCCDVNDYAIHRILKDNKNSNICYILYRIVSTDYVAKIEKQKDESYKLLSTISISKIGSANFTNPSYYTRRGLEFICQTTNNILIYDNFCIINLNKELTTVSKYNLRQPINVDSIDNDFVTFVDITYTQYCIYDCTNNALFTDWTNVKNYNFQYIFSFNNGNNIFPFISNSYFSKGFKYYNNIQRNDYEYESYTLSWSAYNKGTTYYALIKHPSTFFNNTGTVQFFSSSGYWFEYNSGNTRVINNINSTGLQTSSSGRQIIHTNIQKQFTIYNHDQTKEYTITTEDTNGFRKFFVEKFNNNLLVINNTNNMSNIYLFDQNINLLIQTTLPNPFLICDKYNEYSFCLLDSSHSFYIFKLTTNNYIEQLYYISNINAFSVNNGNIWAFNNQKFEILTQGTPQDLSVSFEQETYEYQDVYINSYVQMYAKNFLSEYLNINVKLTLSGPCVFENNSNILITNTGNSITTIPVIIRGADKCTCSIEEV